MVYIKLERERKIKTKTRVHVDTRWGAKLDLLIENVASALLTPASLLSAPLPGSALSHRSLASLPRATASLRCLVSTGKNFRTAASVSKITTCLLKLCWRRVVVSTWSVSTKKPVPEDALERANKDNFVMVQGRKRRKRADKKRGDTTLQLF